MPSAVARAATTLKTARMMVDWRIDLAARNPNRLNCAVVDMSCPPPWPKPLPPLPPLPPFPLPPLPPLPSSAARSNRSTARGSSHRAVSISKSLRRRRLGVDGGKRRPSSRSEVNWSRRHPNRKVCRRCLWVVCAAVGRRILVTAGRVVGRRRKRWKGKSTDG